MHRKINYVSCFKNVNGGCVFSHFYLSVVFSLSSIQKCILNNWKQFSKHPAYPVYHVMSAETNLCMFIRLQQYVNVSLLLKYLTIKFSEACHQVLFLYPANDEVYSIQHYAIKFSPRTPVSSINKTDRHGIIPILLKVAFKHHNLLFLYHYNFRRLIFIVCRKFRQFFQTQIW